MSGWGGPGGYVFQKAYIEFFCPPHKLPPLLSLVQQHPSLSLMAVNAAASHVHTAGPGTPVVTAAAPPADHEEEGTVAVERSVSGGQANVVTWGVFPGREVLQPSVVEFHSFMAWKDEAFAGWLQDWAPLYDTTAATAAASGSGIDSVAHKGMDESSAQEAKELLAKVWAKAQGLHRMLCSGDTEAWCHHLNLVGMLTVYSTKPHEYSYLVTFNLHFPR